MGVLTSIYHPLPDAETERLKKSIIDTFKKCGGSWVTKTESDWNDFFDGWSFNYHFQYEVLRWMNNQSALSANFRNAVYTSLSTIADSYDLLKKGTYLITETLPDGKTKLTDPVLSIAQDAVINSIANYIAIGVFDFSTRAVLCGGNGSMTSFWFYLSELQLNPAYVRY